MAENFTRMIVTLSPSLKTKRSLYPFKVGPYDLGTNFLIEASAKFW